MTVVNKIKQLTELDIGKLILFAKADHLETEMGVARWIIAHSPTWRYRGYAEIIKAIREHGGV